VNLQTRGPSISALRWTSKSTYELARELTDRGYKAWSESVHRMLPQMGYSLQAPATPGKIGSECRGLIDSRV